MPYSKLEEPHFIIGNGKSLNDTPLHLLEGRVSWGMNRIHLLYPKTSWRPTFFFMVDHNEQNERGYWQECLTSNAHEGARMYLWEDFRNGLKNGESGIGELPRTTWIKRCESHHYYMGNNYMKRAQSWHLPEVCTAFSGIFAVMQLAVLHGATELVLLGCDLYGSDYSENFFVEDYAHDPRDRHEIDNTNMIWGHKVAQRSSPVPIYNATYGGFLEVHPRISLEKYLDGELAEKRPTEPQFGEIYGA